MGYDSGYDIDDEFHKAFGQQQTSWGGGWPRVAKDASFQTINAAAVIPAYKSTLAAGFDIAVIDSATIYPGERRLFHTGLIIKPPLGHWTMIVPRSSLQKRNLMLANQVGVVDEDYCGPEDEILIFLRNLGERPQEVVAGDRVVQGIFIEGVRANFHFEGMVGVSRGGFGSTGT